MVPEGLDHIMHVVVPVFFVEKDPSFQQPYCHGHCGRRAEARQFFAARCRIVQGEQMFFVRRVVWFCGRQVHGGAPPHVFGFAVGAFRLAFTIIPTHSDALKNIGGFPRTFSGRHVIRRRGIVVRILGGLLGLNRGFQGCMLRGSFFCTFQELGVL